MINRFHRRSSWGLPLNLPQDTSNPGGSSSHLTQRRACCRRGGKRSWKTWLRLSQGQRRSMRNLRANLKTPQANWWYDAKITHHNHMQNLQAIDEALDGVVENRVEDREGYQQSCFGHWQRIQRGMVVAFEVIPTLARQFKTIRQVEQLFQSILKESELTPIEVDKGLWYYQGIDELGNMYPDEASATTMLGAGDLSAFAEHVWELREANLVTQTSSSSRASEQQSTNIAASSSVLVASSSVSAAPSSVPAAHAPAPALVMPTHVRLLQTTQTVGFYAEHEHRGTTGTDVVVPDVGAQSQHDSAAFDSASHDPIFVPNAKALEAAQ
ncbi:hypothetical protein LWI28_012779 [Acer negundo]|uniref:Uncharacterized protein n=1 Tax=Acer negundo TaxID=4023 RepID=A0AAD5NH68_ACENE|nr:hypothetical protein LWI28_012779 [Acer negundo]